MASHVGTYDAMKRSLDFLAGAALLAAASPLLAAVSIGIRATMGSPVFFTQQRPGHMGKPFRLYKFRTMNILPEDKQAGVPDKGRATPLGRILRELSIDELPELLNVLRGDMSLVGPRPLLMRYYPYFTERERRRFDVRPGITGWAQIHGRSNLPWDQRLEMDVWYVENRSLLLDIKILAQTAIKVFQRKDVHFVPTEGFMHDLDVERRLKKEQGGG